MLICAKRSGVVLAVVGCVALAFTSVAHADQPPPNVDQNCIGWTCQTSITVPGQVAAPAPGRPPARKRSTGTPNIAANERAAAGQGAGASSPPNPVVTGLLTGVALGQPPAAPRAAAPQPVIPPRIIPPAVIAQRAISNLTLTAPPIQMSPPPDSQGATIGFPVWMWLQPGIAATGPITAAATAGGVTVTATARLQRVIWTMGDGSTVTCIGPGTPFALAQAGTSSPDCGHTYTAKSAAVTVRATSIWQVTWQGGGATGQATLQPDAQVQLPVREVRTLNTIGGN